MRRKNNDKQNLRAENLEDTLEFLSLDDETIEEYSRTMSKSGGKRNYRDEDAEYEDVDDEDYEDYEEVDDEDYEDEDYEEVDDEDYEDMEDEDFEDIEDIEDEDIDDISDEDEEYYEDIEDIDDDENYEDIEDEDYEDIDDEDDIEDISDEFYDDIDDGDYEEDYEEEEKPRKAGFIPKLVYFVKNTSSADRIVAVFGFFIIIVAAITGTLYVNARTTSKQVETFAEIGNDIEGIGIIGESGLIAVSDAEAARLSRMLELEEEQQRQIEKEEEEKNKVIEVGMNITSIQSDIKVKFVNKETNKLIAGVPFEVEVTGSKGKSFDLKDEDKDGVIYQTGVNADTYTVKAAELKGEEYAKYHFANSSESIKVTDTIAYKKVDVADEIKSEKEVNAAAEDTAKQTETESTLQDTVEWVESTKTEIESDESYKEIKKGDIPDPSTTGKAANFMKFAQMPDLSEEGTQEPGTEPGDGGNNSSDENDNNGNNNNGNNNDNNGDNGNEGGDNGDSKPKTDKEKLEALKPSLTPTSVNIKKGESVSLIFSTQVNGSYILDWASSNTSVALVDGGEVMGVGAGSANVTATIKLDSSSSASITLSCAVTVTEDTPDNPNPTPTYKMKSVTGGGNINIGKTCTVSGTTEPEGGKITWSSSNTKIATVDGNGLVTGISTGTVSIIGTSESGDSKECLVTVEAGEVTYKSVTIKGDKTVQVGKTVTLTATTEPAGGSVSWTSDNEKVVKIDNSGNMTGVSAGSATITATCGTAKNTLKVTVTKGKDVTGDTKTKLKDKKGNQIYIKNSDGKYVEATYADYFKNNKFYLKSGNVKYRYTGWQTIDGYTYFFDKNGNYVTGEQVIQGAKYNFGSDGRLSSSSGSMGIDVSKWNGSIDWNAVRNSGVSYVIIRCGYRGSSTGALIEDPKFVSNIKGAKAAGLKVGVYFFSQAVNEVEAVEEASMVLNLVKGYGLNYPVFLDVEASGGRGDSINAATRTAVCKAFCATIQNSGYSAGIYANKTWLTSYINTGSLTGYKIWLAQYAASPSYTATRYDMWQYSSKGRVSGISGNVDMNISYLNY